MAEINARDRLLQSLIVRQTTGALATLDHRQEPAVSMVPYAIDAQSGSLVIHVSELASHTQDMARHPRVAFLIVDTQPVENVRAQPRVSLSCTTEFLTPACAAAERAQNLYLARFPDSALMTQLPDFHFVVLTPIEARHVAGFGAARTVEQEAMVTLLQTAASA